MADAFPRKNARKCYEKYINRQAKKKLGTADAITAEGITKK